MASIDIGQIKKEAESLLARELALQLQLYRASKRKRDAAISLSNWIQAEQVIREAAKATHGAISINLSSICSQALNEILNTGIYELKIEGVERRNNLEMDVNLYKSGKLQGNPLESNGGGICDILSMTLMFVCWKMSGCKLRNLFVLDEPFKNLSPEYQERACSFFSELSRTLELNVLMVTHVPNFIENAEHVIKVIRKGGASCTESTKGERSRRN